jgi:hypothetical protein
MAYGVLRATVLGFFFDVAEDEETEIAGPIVISDGERETDTYAPPRGIAPRGGQG